MNHWKRIYGKFVQDRWDIGFVEGGLEAVMSNGELNIHWLEHPYKDRWFADPFILDVTDSEIVVLVEEYQYGINKGRIAALIVDKFSYELKELKIILELDTHLSFPAIWREGNRIYVYPESWASGRLCLYEWEGVDGKLKEVQVICDEAMTDAIMTDRFGKRMLFSTKRHDLLRRFLYDSTSGKFVFSDEIKFDREIARNAGDLFDYCGEIYRPAQRCDHRYGEAIEIQKVSVNEKGEFNFVPMKSLLPPDSRWDGMHTLNSFKEYAVIDVHSCRHPNLRDGINKLRKHFK
ncbi:MAG: hypothetical protein K5920_03855 [Bacteroidales bacterium]|nr:hypothetical protein [Bacteroidales bacterium]